MTPVRVCRRRKSNRSLLLLPLPVRQTRKEGTVDVVLSSGLGQALLKPDDKVSNRGRYEWRHLPLAVLPVKFRQKERFVYAPVVVAYRVDGQGRRKPGRPGHPV
jgi:hypothetical protein